MLINTSIKPTFCIIIILLYTSTLFGMESQELDIILTLPATTQQQKNAIDRVEEWFLDGITQYGLGDKKKSKAILTGSYHYAKEHGILDLVYAGQLKAVCNLLYELHYETGCPEAAVEYAIDKTKKGICYRHLAQKAHKEENFELEKKYYAKAFDLFEQSYRTNAQAKKQYEDALWCGRGYEYNPLIIKNYYLNQLQTVASFRNNYMDWQTYLLSNKIINQALTKLSQLSQDDPDTQCTLAEIYVDGREGIPPSHRKSLQLCRDAVGSLAFTEIGNSLHEYTKLPRIIEKLYTDSDLHIQQEALILKKYFNILSAIKKGNNIKLQQLAELYHNDTTINSLPLQLLCSNVNPCIEEFIKNSPFDDSVFIEFWTSEEGKLAAHILEWALLDLSLTPPIKDLFYIVIGAYHYHNNNFNAAIAHFTQCSTYIDDLYLQVLSIKEDPYHCHKQLVSMLPIIQKSIEFSSKNKKNYAAKKIIAEICGYNSLAPIEDILSVCQEWVPLLAVLNNNQYPLEYIYVLMGLDNIRKNTNLLSTDQYKTATNLITYFNFFSLLQANDQKKLDVMFATKNSQLTGIRRRILKTIRGNNKNDIQKIIFENEAFAEFCTNDLPLLKIITHIAEHPHDRFKIKPAQCHYILGGLAYVQRDYSRAYTHFLQCDQNDFYLQAKILETAPLKNICKTLETCALLFNQQPINDKTRRAKAIIANIINTKHAQHVELLLKEEKYQEAYTFAQALTKLNELTPSHILCNTFIAIENSIIKKPPHRYKRLLTIPERISTYNAIKTMAEQKNHDGCLCDCIALILSQHSKYSHIASIEKTALEKECLKYLSCSLKHDMRTNDSQKEAKHSLYGNLAYSFGMLEKSIPLLDEAIKYNNQKALYEKAQLLIKEKPISPENLLIAINLLKQHTVSQDNNKKRALSYKTLGKYYSLIERLEHQKKAFDYLKAAADLGNYDAGHLLALFYINGLENYQAPNREQALMCLEKTIERKKQKHSIYARWIRALIYYKDNQDEKSHEDLISILDNTYYDDSQKLCAYWLMGLVKLSLNGTNDLSEGLVSYFQKTYDSASLDKRNNPNSSYIKEFMLCKDEKTFNNIQKNINHIIANNKTDYVSLHFCTVIGSVIFEQNQTEPITNQYRALGIKSLQYAAKNNHTDALSFLLQLNEQDISLNDKISYLIIKRNRQPYLAQRIDLLLATITPQNIVGQALAIIHLDQQNNDLVPNHISHLYKTNKPLVIDPIGYSSVSTETIEKTIEKCLAIESLQQAADGFIKNKQKSIPLEHFSALFLGSLLAYSRIPKELIMGARYLEAAYKYFPTIHIKYIEENLGYIYYKLGLMHTHESKKNIPMAVMYLTKGMQLENPHSILLLNKLYLDKTPGTDRLDANTLIRCLQTIHSETPSENSLELLRQYNVQELAMRGIVDDTIPQETTDKKINTTAQLSNTIAKQRQHPTYTLLIIPSEQPINEDILKAAHLICSGNNHRLEAINLFKFYAEKKDPHACLHCALIFYNNKKTIKKYLANGMTYGIIKTAHSPHGMFKDIEILNSICYLIVKALNDKTKQKKIILQMIKQRLIKQEVNLNAFETFCKEYYVDLSTNKEWNTAS